MMDPKPNRRFINARRFILLTLVYMVTCAGVVIPAIAENNTQSTDSGGNEDLGTYTSSAISPAQTVGGQSVPRFTVVCHNTL